MLPTLQVCLGCYRQALLQNTGAKCKKHTQENHPKLPNNFSEKEKERQRKKENMQKEKEGKKPKIIKKFNSKYLNSQKFRSAMLSKLC